MKKCNIDIRTAMMKKGITQADLADKMEVSRETLNKWLRFEIPKEMKADILAAIKEM